MRTKFPTSRGIKQNDMKEFCKHQMICDDTGEKEKGFYFTENKYPHLSPTLITEPPRRRLPRGYPGTSRVAAKGGTQSNTFLGTHKGIHFWGQLSYSIISLVFPITCRWHGALPHNSLLPVSSHLILTILRQHLSLSPFKNDKMTLKGLCDPSGVTEMIRDTAGGT